MSERLSAAEAIVKTLEHNGLEHLFCLPGGQRRPRGCA